MCATLLGLILRGEMSISDFWFSVAASIVASLLITIGAKISLRHWLKVAFGVGATVGVFLIVGVVAFAGITVTKQMSNYFERSSLQKKIDNYTKGHYPDDFEQGYRLRVEELSQRPLLVYTYPEHKGYPDEHPLNHGILRFDIQKLLNDSGYPGEPIWGHTAKTMTREQIEKMLQRTP